MRTVGFAGGVHYLQYSFAPRLYIFNAFLQSLIGLHDFGKIAGDARATRAVRGGRARGRARRSRCRTWATGRATPTAAPRPTRDYHELLREFLASMCTRRLGELYCDYADRYRGYQVDPPELTYTGPELTTAKQLTPIRFEVSKLSAVEAKVYRGDKLVVLEARHVPPRRRRLRVAPARPRACSRCGWAPRSCAPGWQEGQGRDRDRGGARAP